MKILVIANYGMGLYKFRKELLEELIENDHEVIIDLPYDDYVPLLQDLGCQYIKSDLERRGTNPLKDFKTFFSYLIKLKRVKPDIVLTYTVKPNIYGGLACTLTKTPYLSNITGLGTSFEKDNIIKSLIINLYKVSLKASRCIFFQNNLNRSFFVDNNITKTKTTLLPGSGVNLIENNFEEYPPNDQNINFLFIGRIMKAKGIEEYLNAARFIKKELPYVHFGVIGFCEENYDSILEDLDSAGIIKYYGEQANVRRFIRDAHAIVLPSYHEGMSNVLLEAASNGRPVIASNIPGCRETFDEGVSGMSFKPKDGQDLINTLTSFIKLPYEEKKQMGINGRDKMKKVYDRRIIIDAYLEEINRIEEQYDGLVREN